MQAFSQHRGLAAPLRIDNVDTDQIIPKQFLKSVERTGFGSNLFDSWRYADEGRSNQQHTQRPINPDFVLNQLRYEDASILLCGDNFGCGSSREHAPWALLDYGFKVLIAPSFANIFYNNCLNNGLLPVVLPTEVIADLFTRAESGLELLVDLEAGYVEDDTGKRWSFEMNGSMRSRLLRGLDDIGLTLDESEQIERFEAEHRQANPWLFNDPNELESAS